MVAGVGPLREPVTPDFPGADTFKGQRIHTAEWPAEFDPSGKRVAIIGTGASAVQTVPSIADKVQQSCYILTVDTWPMAVVLLGDSRQTKKNWSCQMKCGQ